MRTLLFIALLLTAFHTHSQNIALSNSVTDIITKSTPQAYQFQKYGDMPVNVNTGTANVQVPLFKIAIKNVEWDISLAYQTAGIRVSELSGCVGLGWNLQAPGLISSRTLQRSDVFGETEANVPANKKTFQLLPTLDPSATICYYVNSSDVGFVNNMMAARENDDSRNIQNFMPDIFYLSAGSLNAKFFLKNNQGYCMPSKDIAIEHFSSPNHFWVVKDEQGNKFTFELSGGNASNYYFTNWPNLEGPGGNPASYGNYNPVFVLKKIENLFGDKIEFFYTKEFYTYRGTDKEVYVQYPSPGSGCGSKSDGFDLNRHKLVFNEVCDSRLDSIVSTRGDKIVFAYNSRTDLAGASKLNTVTRYYKTAAVTKFVAAFKLNNSYFGTGTDPRDLRLKLDSVEQLDVNNQKIKAYSFTYNPTSLPSRISPSQDAAGFYNGQPNSSLVPVAGNSRSFSLEHTKACVLEKISYPTGGYTLFNYEQKLSGGLRIKNVKDYNIDGALAGTKEYEYALVQNAIGADFFKDIQYDFLTCVGSYTPPVLTTCTRKETYTEPAIDVYNSFYGDATERYGRVTEYIGPNGLNGKIEYQFGQTGLSDRLGMPSTADLLTKKTMYSKVDTSWKLLAIENKIYETLNESETSTSFFQDAVNPREVRTYGLDFEVLRPEMVANSSACGDTIRNLSNCYPARYFQQGFRLVSTPVMLKEEQTTTYQQNSTNAINKTINYSYLPNTILVPIAMEEAGSDSSWKKQTTRYPLQFAGITATDPISLGVSNLVDRHVINLPVEQSSYKKVDAAAAYRLTSSIFTVYKTNTPVPDKMMAIESLMPLTDFVPAALNAGAIVKDARYVDKIAFTDYDLIGNLLQQRKVNDINVSYIWDYQLNYPIAEIKGATAYQVAYTSFEADNFSNLQILQPLNITVADGLTGDRSYAINGGLNRANLDPANTYLVSLWTKNGIPTYTGYNGAAIAIPASSNWTTGKTANTWTYREKIITGVTSINISGGGGLVDEVRIVPKDAQVTTYTYLPAVGLSSQSSANNNITYYEYDGFNRLLRVRDEDKNILKQYDYQFQAPNNPNALWTPTGNTRCKPCPANSNYLSNILQQEEKDLSPQSHSYNQLRWVDLGPGGNCVAAADWQYTTTSIRCQVSYGKITGYQEKEQRDKNPCSPTYNQTRWVQQSLNCTACQALPNWQPTGNYRCVKDAGNNNTGERQREERDNASCSPTYNQLRWVTHELQSTSCPTSACNASNCYGENKKCINGTCETSYSKIYTRSSYDPSTGMYECTYHYEFSDSSWSQDYTEYNNEPCAIQ